MAGGGPGRVSARVAATRNRVSVARSGRLAAVRQRGRAFYWSKDVYNAAKPVVTVTHVYLNRSQLDVLGGMFGFLKRSVLEGRIRRDTPQILRALRDRLESGEPTGEPLKGKRVLPKKFIAYRKSVDPHIR